MILATNNEGKLREIKQIFQEYKIESLKDKNIDVEVIEDQDTFYGNALKKAKAIFEIAKCPVIADDSGLCIDSLNDFPGVFTHRFLGEDKTDEERNEELIKIVNKEEKRSARVICNLVYYDGKDIILGEGILKGKITKRPRGNNGFGFDPIFELENGKTLAELTTEEKNEISARHLAALDLKGKIKTKTRK